MARFLPYDQTGFARLDPSANRRSFAAGAQWMKPSELAKRKDWSTPAGLQSALQLSKALVENPVTDLAVKGVGELANLFKDPAVRPEEKSKYDQLTTQIADAKARMEAMGERPQRALDESDQEVQTMYGTFNVKPGDVNALEKAIKDKYGDSPNIYNHYMKQIKDRLLPGADEYDVDQQNLAHELVGLERQQEEIDFTIDNEDELYAFAAQNPDHVEWAMGQVSRVAPAPTLSELRTGKTPASRIRKNLLDLSKRTMLTPAQELVQLRHNQRMSWNKEKEERRKFERNRRWNRVLEQDKEGVKLTGLKEDKLKKQLELLDRKIQAEPRRREEFVRAFTQILKAKHRKPEDRAKKLRKLTDLFKRLYPSEATLWETLLGGEGKVKPSEATPSAAAKRQRGKARRAARSGNVMEQIKSFNEQRVALEREYGALSAEEKTKRFVEFDERFKGLLAGYNELQTSQKPGKKEGRKGRVATLDPKINDALRKGVTAVNTWRRSIKLNEDEKAAAAKDAKAQQKAAAKELKSKQAETKMKI